MDVDMANVRSTDIDIGLEVKSNTLSPDPLPQVVSNYHPMNDEQLSFIHSTVVNWSLKIPEGEFSIFNPKKNPSHTVKSAIITHTRFAEESTWQLLFSSDHFHQKRTRTVAIHLWRLPDNAYTYNWWQNNDQDALTCMYKVQILDVYGNPVFTKESGFRSIRKNDCYGWKDFAPFDKVKPYIVNGIIQLRLEIKSFYYNTKFELADICKDVKIQFGNCRPIKARKDVIMQKSKKLYEYFYQTDNRLDDYKFSYPSNYSMKVIHNIFDYMSRGRCPLIQTKDFVELPSLWDCACDLQVEDLKVDVFDTLVHSDCLKVANVTALVIFVHKNKNDIKVKAQYAKSYNKLKRFVKENIKEISESTSFKKMFHVSKEVTEEFANLIMENDLFVPFSF